MEIKCICILSAVVKVHGAHLRIIRCMCRMNGPPTLSDPLKIFTCSLGIFHIRVL